MRTERTMRCEVSPRFMGKTWRSTALPFVGAVVMLIGAGIAFAEAPRPTGNVGSDDRRPLQVRDAPWAAAVGQVNIGGFRSRGMCTGTLIAPRLVLTAAHCVIDTRTGSPFPAKHVHFAAGVHRDSVAARASITCIKVPEGRLEIGPVRRLPNLQVQSASIDRFALDLAMLVLSHPLEIAPIPLAEGAVLERGTGLVHAAYPADRRFQLMVDSTCQALAETRGIWLTNCDTRAGSSGGPVLTISAGEPRVVAVMVGIAGSKASIATPITAWQALPKYSACPPVTRRFDR